MNGPRILHHEALLLYWHQMAFIDGGVCSRNLTETRCFGKDAYDGSDSGDPFNLHL